MSWENIIDEFCIDMKVQFNFKESSIVCYKHKIKEFSRKVSKEIEEITDQDARQWKIDLLASDRPQNTKRQEHSIVKRFFQWYSKKYKRPDPTIDFYALPEEIKDPFFPTPMEVIKMISLAGVNTFNDRRNAAIIAMFAGTGIRPIEMKALNVGDVNIKSKQEFEIDVPMKKSRSRRIPFGNIKAMDIIASTFGLYYLELMSKGSKKTDPLFYSLDNAKIKKRLHEVYLHRIVRNYGDKVNSNKKINPKSLRHFFGTYLTYKDINLERLRYLMGHALLSTTQRYIHLASMIDSNVTAIHPLATVKRPELTKINKIIQSL